MYAIEVLDVIKDYKLYEKNSDVIKEIFTRKKLHRTFQALSGVSFKVKKGITYGVVGNNGSGKSTVLSLINGTSYPTSGKVKTRGAVSLLNVGAGIIGSNTGRENIYYKCALSGLTQDQIDERIDSIIEFSELGEFIEQPVEKYSSGMKSKLGFAIAIHIEPEILIIDEALAVGDKVFRLKCMDKMNSLKAAGITILFVSHSESQVKSFCDRACWIHKGELIAKGESANVVKLYGDFMNKKLTIEAAKELVRGAEHLYYVD